MGNIDVNILIEEYLENNKKLTSELMIAKAYIKQLEGENRELKIEVENNARKKDKEVEDENS